MKPVDDFDYAVLEFMQDFGTTMQYTKIVAGEYDVETGVVSSTEEVTDVEGIILDLTLQSNGYSTKYGTMVQAGDKEIFVRPPKKADSSADNLVVDPATDFIVVGDVEWKVVTFKEVNPVGDDNPILFSFYVRH